MPLQAGTWSINANGSLGQLVVTSADAAGNFAGTLTLNGVSSPASGFWDEISQKLMFVETITSAGVLLKPSRAYTGFLFRDQFRMPGLTGSVVFTLAGSFEIFQDTGGTADRPVFGWYAQISAT